MTSRSSSQSTTTVTPDLTGMKIAHRAMLDDTRRFAEILGRIGAGEPCDNRRRRAIGDYLTQLCAAIHHHHTIEDEIVWPILTASAGAAVDVRELQDDHTELEALLAVLGTHVGGFVRARSGDTRAAGSWPRPSGRPTSCSPSTSPTRRRWCSRSSTAT
ncbi:UNVERIFIED_ORG: hemerythrin HHE cation binding domain-containing protein [Gordonia westfalica J30]